MTAATLAPDAPADAWRIEPLLEFRTRRQTGPAAEPSHPISPGDTGRT